MCAFEPRWLPTHGQWVMCNLLDSQAVQVTPPPPPSVFIQGACSALDSYLSSLDKLLEEKR